MKKYKVMWRHLNPITMVTAPPATNRTIRQLLPVFFIFFYGLSPFISMGYSNVVNKNETGFNFPDLSKLGQQVKFS